MKPTHRLNIILGWINSCVTTAQLGNMRDYLEKQELTIQLAGSKAVKRRLHEIKGIIDWKDVGVKVGENIYPLS